ncbi:NAD(P)/FAD-dependent oxidoreductase [Sphingomonas panacisoli]|uniref:Pyridine nucleotide-disulfide oxidoreductase domain-containing protein 2 n=1 Tax=Sphingomonas panacisoli TaxID=1813879 RepID=A0A5B8LEH3_9SPHN|nr:NAD(P)/FAD-dependent oxidoreductase [Sphingomonas panacisoli]QDZ06578.1 NAD(P)/FAD-dependent oxidoreductase [Sphingomonas panacisoli]
MTTRYDALIIGGGHNGLVCAFYLARAGLKVRILERRDIIGGAAVTEEFAPGFRNSTASYTVSLLRPKVIADMRLHERGWRIVERTISNFFPHEDGYLKLGGGTARTQAEFARFSQKDADTFPRYEEALERVAEVLRDMALKTPPNAGGGLRALLAAAVQGKRLAGMNLEAQRDVMDLFVKSARDFLEGWYQNEFIQAAFGFDAVVGNYASPDTPGSAYVLLHHVFGEINGKKGMWGHSVGGMGAITRYMAEACAEMGVEISLEARVAKVLVDGGKAVGVRLESGEEIAATTVIANAGPALVFRQLVDRADLPADFAHRIDRFKTGSGTFRMNVALSELPDFTVLPGKEKAEHHTAGIIIAPTLDYMDHAYTDAKANGWSKQPIVEMKIPSTVDDSLAPSGQHVASLFCQQFDPAVDWDAHRETVADLIIDTVTHHAPNFKSAVIARQIHSPLDLERKFGLIGGDIFHGHMSLDQLWAARPMLGHGDYRSPIKGLYMCGSGTHPGGGVTGAPGHNAAHEILRDRSLFGRLFG